MPEAKNGPLRQQLIELLKGGGAHVKFEDVIDGFPEKLRGAKAPGIPHSPWMLLEHMRIAQKTSWSSAATKSTSRRSGRRVTGRNRRRLPTRLHGAIA